MAPPYRRRAGLSPAAGRCPVRRAGRTATPAKAGTSSAATRCSVARARPTIEVARSTRAWHSGSRVRRRSASRRWWGPTPRPPGCPRAQPGGAHGRPRRAAPAPWPGPGRSRSAAARRRHGRGRPPPRRAAAPAPRCGRAQGLRLGTALAAQLAHGPLEGLLSVQQAGGVAAHGAAHPGAGPGVAPDQGVAHRAGLDSRRVPVAGGTWRSRRPVGDVQQRPRAVAAARRPGPAARPRRGRRAVSTASWVAPSPTSTKCSSSSPDAVQTSSRAQPAARPARWRPRGPAVRGRARSQPRCPTRPSGSLPTAGRARPGLLEPGVPGPSAPAIGSAAAYNGVRRTAPSREETGHVCVA